ncbi:hypothetical protein [Ktedonospora formicarum]|uniref:Uncharacterized protein n=1 Tax=Ktedonospora formicarum TaxID=2778364 RepID=A0A8J3I6E8_9CHLR|nr:hypothetical protein [Ktedonospora formicarum]GHO46713.1 hypothetical protein KSX_48760 [Ktedonospora formicarum]
MEEGSSDTAANTRRLEELLDQLGTRYDKSLSGLTEEEPIAPSNPISQPSFPPPGTWLNELKSLETPIQTDANAVLPANQTSLASTTDPHSGIQSGPIVAPPLAYPQVPGEFAKRVSQSGIQNTTVSTPSSRTTDKLDEKSLSFPVGTKSDTSSQPVPKPAPNIVRILPDPPRRASGNRKRRSFIPAIVCLVLLTIAGIFWLMQQSNANLLPEVQQETNSIATAANTPALQNTPGQTPTDSHHPTQTTTPKTKATPTTPSNPTTAPTSPPTQVVKPPVTSTSALSFEDGGTDGWIHSDPDGTLYSVKNQATSSAKDGSHVLMVSYNSDNSSSYPTLETPLLPKTLKSGQTITAYILKTQGSSVEASLYIADQNDTWYKATSDSNVAFVNSNQTWYSFTFRVPSNIQGPATKVGIILFGYNAVVYIDAIDWN